METVGSQPGTWRDIGCFLRERDRRTGGVDCARFSGLGELSGVQKAVTEEVVTQGMGPPGPRMSLKGFVEKRREYLLAHPEIRQAAARN